MKTMYTSALENLVHFLSGSGSSGIVIVFIIVPSSSCKKRKEKRKLLEIRALFSKWPSDLGGCGARRSSWARRPSATGPQRIAGESQTDFDRFRRVKPELQARR